MNNKSASALDRDIWDVIPNISEGFERLQKTQHHLMIQVEFDQPLSGIGVVVYIKKTRDNS